MTIRVSITSEDYQDAASELVRRIDALVPTHPEILEITSPWELFKVDGFVCDDIEPSLTQAMWALGAVKKRYAGSTT